MVPDALLAQPPEPVRDDGFSRRVAILLYQRRMLRRMVASIIATGAMLALMIVLPTGRILAALPLQLSTAITSPWMPWIAGGTAVVLLALRPRARGL